MGLGRPVHELGAFLTYPPNLPGHIVNVVGVGVGFRVKGFQRAGIWGFW